MSIKIEGMSQVRRALLKVTEAGHKAASSEVVRSGLNIQRGAKQRAPVDTGRLRNSIAVAEKAEDIPTTEGKAVARNAIRPGMLDAVVGTSVDYAPPVEFGVRGRPGQPFLHPALEEESPQFVDRMAVTLGAEFVKVRG